MGLKIGTLREIGAKKGDVVTFDENVNYNKYLEELESLNSTVSKFFEDVLVMDKDEDVKNNRIALLSLLKGKYEHLTDFSKI